MLEKVEELYYPCSDNKDADRGSEPLFLANANSGFLMTRLICKCLAICLGKIFILGRYSARL